MQIIDTSKLPPNLNRSESLWIYNGLDCMITLEVFDAILPQLNKTTAGTYQFSRDMQGPILEMNMRGLLVDEPRRQEVMREYRESLIRVTDNLNRLIREGIGWDFVASKGRKYEWPSDDQLKTLFFDVLGIPEIKKRNTNGDLVRTVDRDALEKIEDYFYAEPIVKHMYVLRDLQKKLSFLDSAIDADGRLRTSFNIAGTNTGRLASSFSDYGTGTNLQNVENILRSIFVPDPGMKFCNIDLEQSDGRVCGAIHWNLFRDGRYLDACESGDLHTSVARIAFPKLPWTMDLRSDKAIASDSKFYREFSYRDASKRLGHGTNYQGQPDKMARATHIPIRDIIAFQIGYLKEFPAFKLWWEWVERQVRDTRRITTLLNRQRYFFGHPKDAETIRAAIAFEPQSVTGDTINRGILTLWRQNIVQLLLQVHDSVLFQFPEELEDEIVPRALYHITNTVRLKDGRDFIIPAEAKVGWNWSDFNPARPDPDALHKYSDPTRPKRRTRTA